MTLANVWHHITALFIAQGRSMRILTWVGNSTYDVIRDYKEQNIAYRANSRN